MKFRLVVAHCHEVVAVGDFVVVGVGLTHDGLLLGGGSGKPVLSDGLEGGRHLLLALLEPVDLGAVSGGDAGELVGQRLGDLGVVRHDLLPLLGRLGLGGFLGFGLPGAGRRLVVGLVALACNESVESALGGGVAPLGRLSALFRCIGP